MKKSVFVFGQVSIALANWRSSPNHSTDSCSSSSRSITIALPFHCRLDSDLFFLSAFPCRQSASDARVIISVLQEAVCVCVCLAKWAQIETLREELAKEHLLNYKKEDRPVRKEK